MKTRITLWMLLFSCCQLAFTISCNANQIDNLNNLLKSRKRNNPSRNDQWRTELRGGIDSSPVYVGTQEGLMKADKIDTLPGQPLGEGAQFDQYAGYVTIDPRAGRELFYYFVESPNNSSTKPLLLWLNGGPGCSSLGYGALEELGPFRVNSDGKTLFRNEYAWNNEANVIFLESPAGVGFSYSNTSSDYKNAGDTSTARDAYVFLVNWLERFPQYKTHDLYLAGESYAGHYVPQLASTILTRNNMKKNPNKPIINLKGIAIGNAWIDDNMCNKGMYDYLWTHALNSDETNAGITKSCDFDTGNFSTTCKYFQRQGESEIGDIDIYNIYAPVCHTTTTAKSHSAGSVHDFDPCSDLYVTSYLNLPEVQRALHVKSTNWTACKILGWTDSPITILPTIQLLISRGIRVWIFSGDTDGRVPVTASQYSINKMKLPVETPWRPWYNNDEVGGYVVEYKGVTFTTVRGAGHMVPSNQPERALTMISTFLQGKLLPSTRNHQKV